MSYAKLQKQLQAQEENFREDVLEYLIKTGRETRGRRYFGTKCCNNPNLVERLEQGKLPGLEVMLRVRTFMEENPPEQAAGGSADDCPIDEMVRI